MAAPKRSNNLLIIIGLVFLLAGTGLVVVLLRDKGGSGTAANGSGVAGSDLVDVVVSKVAIARGTTAKDFADKVEVRKVATATRPSDAIATLSELAGRTTTLDIGQGQQLRAAFFQQSALRANKVTIPEGKQAIAVTVPFTPAVAGYVAQGDVVNVFATYTARGNDVVPGCGNKTLCDGPAGNQPQAAARLVLSNIAVLDVSQEVAPNAEGATTATSVAGTTARPAGPPTITYLLAVDSAQAERLVFFTSYAELYLTIAQPGQPAAPQGPGRNQNTALNP